MILQRCILWKDCCTKSLWLLIASSPGPVLMHLGVNLASFQATQSEKFSNCMASFPGHTVQSEKFSDYVA